MSINTVYVLCCNDFPDKVYVARKMAEAEKDRKTKWDIRFKQLHPEVLAVHKYWHIEEVPFYDKED